jgi:2-polyprenyl-3-methyl-5-hydroxy-6-metoxy-1,4-benzoquinol methylase
MIDACTICGGTSFEVPVLGPLARCRTCAYVFLPRTPDLPGQIEALYAGEYFTGAEFGDYASQHPTFARNFRAYLDRMRRAGATGGRLLEVGCAYGFFLEQAQRSFDATGIDVNEPAIAAARALGVRAEYAEFLSYPVETAFDVICLWDTIEHLLDPRAYLSRAHAGLRTGGWLFLTTGDIGSAMARLRGAGWRMIHPPSHLNYFSRATMTRLLESVGFDVLPIRSVGTHRDLLNALHLLGLFSKRPLVRRTAGHLERLLAGRIPPLSFYLNLHDIMFVAARKRA